ncbi:hypothetical protein FPOAC2_02508 [Fusarium poae]
MISSTAVMAFEWTILVLAYVLVACRVYVRMFLRGVGLHAADYWLIVGLVSCQGLLICDTLTFRMHAMDDFVLASNSIPIKKGGRRSEVHRFYVNDSHEVELGFELHHRSAQSYIPYSATTRPHDLNKKKIGLAVVFGMGIITIAVSVGRFVTMLYVSNDISIYIWATAEICISVMIVALTALRPLLRKMTNSMSTSSDDRSGNPSRRTGLTRSSIYWPGGNKIPRRHVVEVGSESLAGSETELNNMSHGIMMTKQVTVSVGKAESDAESSR